MKVEKLSLSGFDEVYRLDLGQATAFLVLHAICFGRSFGGFRIRDYAEEEEALEDAKRLARAMSRKVALTGIPGGGGKMVLMAPVKDREEAIRQLGGFVESLGGKYFTGPDMGFTEEDFSRLRAATQYMACGTLTDWTVRSVRLAMGAVCDPASVAIQGLGSVGEPLARELLKQGKRVVAADVESREGFDMISPAEIFDADCEVFSPCAMGGVLNEHTIPRLKAKVVCGAANNPLRSFQDGEALRLRGITYVPDFIASSGGAIAGASRAIGEEDWIEKRMERIPDLVRAVLMRSEREEKSTHEVACAMADEVIAKNRKSLPS